MTFENRQSLWSFQLALLEGGGRLEGAFIRIHHENRNGLVCGSPCLHTSLNIGRIVGPGGRPVGGDITPPAD